MFGIGSVTPRVGVWIETQLTSKSLDSYYVTPRVGVWIETTWTNNTMSCVRSRPAWACGLKLSKTWIPGKKEGHAPRGRVD